MSRKARIVTIAGARPQFIKLSPLHRELSARNIDHCIINTGQHYDYSMAGVFFKELHLPKPAANLAVGPGFASEMTARIIEGCAKALRRLAPDTVAVIGDTNSTLGGALAAVQLGLPLAHIEAGLRCFDLLVPEEVNRVVTDRIANLLLCPTAQSVKNLKAEGIRKGVFNTGDLLYDVLADAKPDKKYAAEFLQRHKLVKGEFLLATIHRADSVDVEENLKVLTKMLVSLKTKAILPLHPRTRKRLVEFGLMKAVKKSKNLIIVEPFGYRDTLAALMSCRMVLTDSGGLQREAYYLKTPTLLLRPVTEWVEINRAGGSKIVGFDLTKLARGLASTDFRFSDRGFCRAGAARRIADRLVEFAR